MPRDYRAINVIFAIQSFIAYFGMPHDVQLHLAKNKYVYELFDCSSAVHCIFRWYPISLSAEIVCVHASVEQVHHTKMQVIFPADSMLCCPGAVRNFEWQHTFKYML